MPKKQKPHFQRAIRVRKRRVLRDAFDFAAMLAILVLAVVVVALLAA